MGVSVVFATIMDSQQSGARSDQGSWPQQTVLTMRSTIVVGGGDDDDMTGIAFDDDSGLIALCERLERATKVTERKSCTVKLLEMVTRDDVMADLDACGPPCDGRAPQFKCWYVTTRARVCVWINWFGKGCARHGLDGSLQEGRQGQEGVRCQQVQRNRPVLCQRNAPGPPQRRQPSEHWAAELLRRLRSFHRKLEGFSLFTSDQPPFCFRKCCIKQLRRGTLDGNPAAQAIVFRILLLCPLRMKRYRDFVAANPVLWEDLWGIVNGRLFSRQQPDAASAKIDESLSRLYYRYFLPISPPSPLNHGDRFFF